MSTASFSCLQLGHAWSGTDSDEGGTALLGVALEGAVSPGFSDQEEVAAEEEHRPRCVGAGMCDLPGHLHLQVWHQEQQAATKEAHVPLQLPIACSLKCLLLPPA